MQHSVRFRDMINELVSDEGKQLFDVRLATSTIEQSLEIVSSEIIRMIEYSYMYLTCAASNHMSDHCMQITLSLTVYRMKIAVCRFLCDFVGYIRDTLRCAKIENPFAKI